jgi:hypothetical protein
MQAHQATDNVLRYPIPSLLLLWTLAQQLDRLLITMEKL